jgi:AcrR family transcriptional regulator
MTATDGRTLRRERTRARLVEAVFDLVVNGDLAPTSRKIAARAGVAERTLFQHFVDLEDLHAAVSAYHVEVVSSRVKRVPPDGPFADRVLPFVRQRAAVLESITPLRLASLKYVNESPALLASRRRWATLAARDLAATFAPELDASDDAETTLLVASTLTSWAAWDELRTARRKSRAAAERVLVEGLTRLLYRPT